LRYLSRGAGRNGRDCQGGADALDRTGHGWGPTVGADFAERRRSSAAVMIART
jgi:hypothetical protein